jgi:hypothetical protein
MTNLRATSHIKALIFTTLALGAILLMSGCSDLNIAVDQLLGKDAPLLASSAGAGVSDSSLVPLQDKRKPIPRRKSPRGKQRKQTARKKQQREGKRRAPGALSPAGERMAAREKQQNFIAPRDPFQKPAEVLPTECPPSMPLCRFDRSQLKLVGIIQINDGQFKGMVEDPDGRGYFVVPGMQLHGSTVTQISNKGVTLRDHKTQQDVLMRLFVESKQPGEF